MKEVLLDANVVLRFLLADHETLSLRAESYFQRAANGELKLLIPSVVAAECVFTLRSFYKMPRDELAAALMQFLSLPNVEPLETNTLKQAITLYGEKNVDFADAYLVALSRALALSVGSFDRDFVKLGAELLED